MSDHPEVGQLIDSSAKRDAIHIAIAPVRAAEKLQPGQTIGFAGEDNIQVIGVTRALSVGIVDPFLSAPVEEGRLFYMFMHPNTITSLRHHWTHPAFGSEEAQEVKDVFASEQWLRNFCATNDAPSYEDMIEAVNNGGETDGGDGYNYIRIDRDYVSVGGQDAHSDIPDEFWDHMEVVTGKKMRDRPTHFSCSC